MLSIVTSPREKAAALQLLEKTLKRGIKFYPRTLGHQGGRRKCTVYWHPHEQIWVEPNRTISKRSFLHGFGRKNPRGWKQNSIVVEINIPKKTFDRRCAGALVRDENGEIFMAHSGKVGGGRKGIGKDRFLDFYGTQSLLKVRWPDESESNLLVITALTDRQVVANVSRFVMKVHEFKKLYRQTRGHLKLSAGSPSLEYTPEFLGKRKKYVIDRTVWAATLHGPVVDALRAELQKHNLDVGNDRKRDLLAVVKNRSATILFEVKTDISTSSIYAAIGQLMLNGAVEKPQPRHVMVLPKIPDSRTQMALKRIGIKVVTFNPRSGRVRFNGLKKCLF